MNEPCYDCQMSPCVCGSHNYPDHKDLVSSTMRHGYESHMDRAAGVNDCPFRDPLMRSWWRTGWYRAHSEMQAWRVDIARLGVDQ